MTTELANLKPYISLMLSRTMSGRDGRELVTEVLSDIEGVLGLQDSEGPLRLISRDGMLAALRSARENYNRRVVILQPRISLYELEAARAEKKGNASSGRTVRLLQLETLLVGAEAVCRSLQAELLVVADGTPVSGRPISTRPTPRRRAKQGGVN